MSLGFTGMGFITKTVVTMVDLVRGVSIVELDYKIYVPMFDILLVLYSLSRSICNSNTTWVNIPKHIEDMNMSNEVLAIIIAIIIMVPAILFYEFIVIRNYVR